MTARSLSLCALVVAVCCALAVPAHAHPLSPPSLSIAERTDAHYQVSFRRSRLAAPRLALDWPSQCRVGPVAAHEQGDQRVDDFELVCKRTLAGQTLRVFGLVELELSLLVYLELAQAEPVRALLSPERASLVFPTRSSAWNVLRDYGALGVAHLLTGPDHILFVLGLLLLVRGLRARLVALTAFTLGHSITLCLSALSVIRLPQSPVELGIALSLLVLAYEVLAEPNETSVRAAAMAQRAWLMAAGFGLLHGLGFASALIETGLPAHAVPLSLFGFNLGVELGQLFAVALLAPCLFCIDQLRGARPERMRSLVAYAIGSLAAMWCIERALMLFDSV